MSKKEKKYYNLGGDWRNAKQRALGPNNEMPEQYANPFSDCKTLKQFKHICSLILDANLNPYVPVALPFPPLGTVKLSKSVLAKGNTCYCEFDGMHNFGLSFMYKDARQCYLKLRDQYPLPKLPRKKNDIREGFEELVDNCIEALKAIKRKDGLSQNPAETKSKTSDKEYSLPLFMKKWAYIFGVSPNKMRELREGEHYHFRKVSPRKWTLPKGELPAEYLEKYRDDISKNPQKQ